MKKFTALFPAVLFLLLTYCVTVYGATKLTVNSTETEDGTVLLPLAAICEEAGYTITTDGDAITITGEGLTVSLALNDDSATVGEDTVDLDAAPQLVDGAVYAPLSLFESLPELYITQQSPGMYTVVKRDMADGDKMIETITTVSANPRGMRNPGIEDARTTITNAMKEAGLTVTTQPFELETFDWGNFSSASKPEMVKYQAVNIIGTVKPSTYAKTSDILIIGSHYDGVSDVPAANDNGSGLSVMLELARILAPLPSDTEIRFVAFDAEESGLNGSMEYVKSLSEEELNRVVGMINFDMLGAAKAEAVKIYTTSGEANHLFDILQAKTEEKLTVQAYSMGGSDHMSFFPKMIPDIMFAHDPIHGEYHTPDDVVANVSKDKLVYAAEHGYLIASEIMSDKTPEMAGTLRPEPDETVYPLNLEKRMPFFSEKAAFEKETGIKFTQVMPRSDYEVLYKANVSLLGLSQPIPAYASGSPWGSMVYALELDMAETGISYDKFTQILTLKFGEPQQHPWMVDSGMDYYIWNSPQGNTINVSRGGIDDPAYTVSIQPANRFEDTQEGYTLQNGELVRMEKGTSMREIMVSRINGEIVVEDKVNQPSKTLPVSPEAQASWNRIKPLLSPEQLKAITFITICTDGIGGETISMYENLASPDFEIPDYTEMAEQLEEGSGFGWGFSTSTGTEVRLDYIDITTPEGAAYTKEDFMRCYLVSYAQRLASSPSQLNLGEEMGIGFAVSNMAVAESTEAVDETEAAVETVAVEAPAEPVGDEKIEVTSVVAPAEPQTELDYLRLAYKEGAYLVAFAEQYWAEFYETYGQDVYRAKLYDENPEMFLNEKAAQSLFSDFAESFAEFVLVDRPAGDSLVEQKVKFFYHYPELIDIKREMLKLMESVE